MFNNSEPLSCWFGNADIPYSEVVGDVSTAVTFVSTIEVISNVFLFLPPPTSSCSIWVPPINIWTFPLLELNPPGTSPVDFAGNEVDSFERTSEIPSKFITGDIVISSENGNSNWSEPVNE